MFKRIFLFLAINALIILTISVILSIFNIGPYISRYGLNLYSLLLFCLVWGMVGALISLALSRKMAKWLMQVKLIDGMGAYATLFRMVERLARNSGLPNTPEVGVFSSLNINAFATGPTKRRSLVALSTALLERMDDHELEAILGHEISHIANGDMVTMTLIQGVVNAFVMFSARVAAFALSSCLGKGQRDNSCSSHGSYYITTFLFEILFMVLGSLLVAGFSRRREFRADRGGALLSRREYMIAALEKLKFTKTGQTTTPPSMNTMMISMPNKGGLWSLFSTHPPIDQRIARLQDR